MSIIIMTLVVVIMHKCGTQNNDTKHNEARILILSVFMLSIVLMIIVKLGVLAPFGYKFPLLTW
jgi:hypothetical protein